MRERRLFLLLALVGSLMLTSFPAHADTLEAPAEVTAQQNGSFSFQVTFHKGPGTSQFAGYSWSGTENVQGGTHADCFCLEFCPVLGPGDTYSFHVSGQLTDPILPGGVGEHFSLCGPGGASATTLIRNFSTTGVGGTPLAHDTRFWNEPNPFAAQTMLRYELAEAGPVRLSIYDLAGRLVADLVNGVQPAGQHLAMWDARPGFDGAGGVLFARLSRGGVVQSRTLIVTR